MKPGLWFRYPRTLLLTVGTYLLLAAAILWVLAGCASRSGDMGDPMGKAISQHIRVTQ